VTPRALVLDLDETLYRERRFALSGFSAVAATVARQDGVPVHQAFARLASALRSGRRACAFQELAEFFGLPRSRVADWIEVYRTHRPRLRLPEESRGVLTTMRERWRVGVLTNGLPAVQARKIEALGLGPLLDTIVFAEEFDGGKPNPAGFLEVLRRLGCEADDSVYAGDDLVKDIDGARRVGFRTVLIARHDVGDRPAVTPDATVRTLAELPLVAERLVGGGTGL
jgi:putative hydrolase of the HAD superfamily